MRIPNEKQRTVLVGRTGSGKTVGGLWHLSNRNIAQMPWVIFDYKGDELIAQLNAPEISLKNVPAKPGIYIVRPLAEVDDEAVESFLWKAKQKGNIGLYFDEGYMLPYKGRSTAYRAIQTQGRSLRIPTITLSQRPVWLDRFVFSESDFFQVYHLNDKRDRQTIKSFMPDGTEERLPDYHSYYYDVGKDDLIVLTPVPDGAITVEKINTIITPEKRSKLFIFS